MADFGDDESENKKDRKSKTYSHHVEFHNFFNAMQLFGAEYDLESALKIFKALDVRANGILSFGQFINWVRLSSLSLLTCFAASLFFF